MMPQISPTSEVVAVPPPNRFRAVVGKPCDVKIRANSMPVSVGNTPAKRAGLLYEKHVQKWISAHNPVYWPQPVFHFRDDSGPRTCVPDGLLLGSGRIAIVEIKSQHMPEAWWQLRRLYEPVVREYADGRSVILLEICKSYDPAMPFPERPTLVDDMQKFLLAAKDGEMGILRWTP